MRALALAPGLFLLAAVAATAQPATLDLPDPMAPQSDAPHLHLPQSAYFVDRGLADDKTGNYQALNARPLHIVPLSQTVLSIGAFKMRLGSDDTTLHFASYHLEDRHFLGGNLSGTLDTRAVTIRLNWPTGN